MHDFVNPFEQEGTWYKANLHTHTIASDGDATVAQAVERYRGKGYDVLAITDHSCTSDVRGLSDDEMLVISGIEYHPPLPDRSGCHHLVGLNVPADLIFSDPNDPRRCIAEVKQSGGETILAHPFWTGLEHVDFGEFEDLVAVEVWNAGCDPAGRACSENEWAYALERRLRLPAVAVDDTHWRNEIDLFAGWTWLKAPKLTVQSVLEALRSGAFYASCGPEIHDFCVENRTVRVRCSPVERIYFKSGPGQGQRSVAANGETICEFSLELPDDWPFVRAVVADARGKCAWTNPIWL